MQLKLYKDRFGMLPIEVQSDKIYLCKENRTYLKTNCIDCYNHPHGRPPREDNDKHIEDKKRVLGERNEIEATFGTSKRIYRANNIRAKLDNTANTWIGAYFFAKNVMKFLRGLFCLIFAEYASKLLLKRIINIVEHLKVFFAMLRAYEVKIN